MTAALKAVVDAIALAASWLVRGLTVLMLVVLSIQVFMRSALDMPPSWSEEVALLTFSWAVLLGIAVGVRDGIHVRMDMLLDVMPPVLRGVFERGVLILITGVGAFLAYAGWNYMMSSVGSTSAAISYPMPLLYASAVVCGFLIVVFGLERLVLFGRDGMDAPSGPVVNASGELV